VAVKVWLSRTGDDPRPVARALLIRAAARMLNLPADAIEVAHEPGGRPYLRGRGAHLYVSVSHCPGVAAVAISPCAAVGVDVEAVRPLPALELALRWLPAAEAAWLRGQPPDRQVRAFLALWTVKEAVGKAYGTGLRGGGLRRAVGVPGPRLAPVGPDMAAATPTAPPGLVLAVACGIDAARHADVAVRVVDRP
jgi:4'-phosphopantetheinyl transferase